MKRAIAYLTANPARFFLAAAIFWITFMGILNTLTGIQWNDIWIEANGMSFDLLVFGVLLSVYEALRQKREKIERLKEEISDYRGWKEPEATYRIVGAIKRLNNLDETELYLFGCFLQKARLEFTDLRYSNLSHAGLQGADFFWADLSDADLSNANLSGADLLDTILEGADLSGVNLLAEDGLWIISEKYLIDKNGVIKEKKKKQGISVN